MDDLLGVEHARRKGVRVLALVGLIITVSAGLKLLFAMANPDAYASLKAYARAP
jgi:hypothetical protein